MKLLSQLPDEIDLMIAYLGVSFRQTALELLLLKWQ